MIDHVGFAVGDAERSGEFYDQLLGAIGLVRLRTIPPEENGSGGTAHGYGRTADDDAFFWIGDNERVGEGTHIAFRVANRAMVHAFHAAGLAAGGRDQGGPGLRPHYGPSYYAAFILDPDGLNVEAVCHVPEEPVAAG
ncbi:glyoxalase/bleomycin resistance/extradiol dioxygenase family protein [Sphingobium lactosutens]|uniref:VOC family protein n=1 Tax=Sphingobium lactosutens TaxID=522773 RepID=UPI0015C07856|nr:VOC family protein [Sphingobium lactosutens]NWK98131.1 glyoxalase/bleomycin resistance/extradiol dioxygenase family protein [Sphingobium lactosutens]